MTTNAFSPAPTYTISGVGPYDVPFEYDASEELVVVVITSGELEVTLDPSGYSVIPAGPATSGTVFLTSAIATQYDGEILTIGRDTTVSQIWQGLASTASGLETQLDHLTRAIQDNQADNARSLQPIGIWRTNVAELLADALLEYTPGLPTTAGVGSKIRTLSEGFAYEVADSAATDHHLTTAGGIKLYVLPTTEGTYSANAFGAVGDGVADDTAALNTFFATLDDFGAVVSQQPTGQLHSGATYRVSDTITLTRSAIIDGQGAKIVSEVNDALKAALYVGDPTTSTYRGQLKNFSLTSIGVSLSAGIQLERYQLGRLENIYISNYTKSITLSSASADPFIGWLDIDKVYTQGGDYGVYGVGVPANVVRITNGRMIQHAVSAVKLDPATTFEFKGNDISLCTAAVQVSNASAVQIAGNYCEACGTGLEGNTDELFTFDNCTNVVVHGQNIVNGLNGVSWRDRKSMARGLAFYGCTDVTVNNNSMKYFLDAAVSFDTACYGRNRFYDNRYSTTFAPSLGVPINDASGTVEIDLGQPPTVTDGFYEIIENAMPVPSDFTLWTQGANTVVTSGGMTSAPPGGGIGLADKVEFLSTGSGRSISRLTSDITGATDKAFALRFWVALDSVDATGTQSGIASIEINIWDGATNLANTHVALSSDWQFIELPFIDTNTAAHAVSISIKASDLVYVACSFGIAGVQVCDARAPYLFCGRDVENSFSRTGPLSFVQYPKAVSGRGVVHLVDIGNEKDPARTHIVGDRYDYPSPVIGGAEGIICVVPGTPGVFVERGTITSTSPDIGPELVTVFAADDWTASGTNTIVDETGAVKITYVDNSTGGTCALDSSVLSENMAAGSDYVVSYEAKAVGAATLRLYNGANIDTVVDNTDWLKTTEIYAGSAGGEFFQVRDLGAGEIFYIRNLSVRKLLV